MGRNNPFNDKPGSVEKAAPATPDPIPPQDPVEEREIETVPGSMWTFAGYILLFALLGFTGYSLFEQKERTDTMRTEIARRAVIIENTENLVVDTKSRVMALETDLQNLKRQKEELLKAQLKTKQEAANAQKNLKDEMRSALESRDVTISELQGNLTLNILDRILFDSGQAIIKPEGEDVLKQIGGVLDQVPNRQIHVLGHTDNVPIRTSSYPSNWELSAARALAAVRFLVDNGGVDPKRIAAVAHGEFQPIAKNTTPEGRARNRRITIVVLPEVFKTPEKPIDENTVAEPALEEESPAAVNSAELPQPEQVESTTSEPNEPSLVPSPEPEESEKAEPANIPLPIPNTDDEPETTEQPDP